MGYFKVKIITVLGLKHKLIRVMEVVRSKFDILLLYCLRFPVRRYSLDNFIVLLVDPHWKCNTIVKSLLRTERSLFLFCSRRKDIINCIDKNILSWTVNGRKLFRKFQLIIETFHVNTPICTNSFTD